MTALDIDLPATLALFLTVGIIAAGVVAAVRQRPRSAIERYRLDYERRQREHWARIVGGKS